MLIAIHGDWVFINKLLATLEEKAILRISNE